MADETGLVVVNFAHPLTEQQLRELAALTGSAVARVIDVPAQVDLAQPLASQAALSVDRAGLDPREWQTLPLLVNPPGLAPLTAALLAELHGRLGHFPALLRLRPAPGSAPTRYEVAEVMNLDEMRSAARERRQG
jgi:hypothetical protein